MFDQTTTCGLALVITSVAGGLDHRYVAPSGSVSVTVTVRKSSPPGPPAQTFTR